MVATTPLQVLLFRHPDDTDVAPLEDAVVRAFQGGKDAANYLGTGVDLGVQLEVFDKTPPLPPPQKLDAFCHTLVIVLVDRNLLDKSTDLVQQWLAACWKHVDGSNGRHRMLAIPMEERLGMRFSATPGLELLQVRPVQDFGEYALRPTMLALLALHEARLLLARPLQGGQQRGCPNGFLRFFISHAKIDGLPLAQSLRHQIKSIKWLETFYDADDLPPGENWKLALEQGVGSSLIIMLRTEVYESRFWCQQEVLWADQYCTPAIMVEARTALNHAASVLPFSRLPIARIPDGNLMRVLSMALREGVRFLLFARSVEKMKEDKVLPPPVELRAFSYPPSMRALLHACQSLAGAGLPPGTKQYIIYPDPPLGLGELEAAQALVEKYAPQAKLVTPQTLATSP